MTGAVDFKGQLASVQMTAHGDWNSSTLLATIEAPAVPPSVWRERLPNSRIEGPTALTAHVHGQLSQLEFDASMQSQAATVNVRGRANLDNTTSVSCEVRALDVNLGPLTGNAISTRLSVSATATLSLKMGGSLEGEYRASAPVGRLGTFQTPSIFTAGNVVRGQDGNTHVDGTLEINELGAPTRARYQLRIPTGANPTVLANFKARLDQPRRLQQLAGVRTNGTLNGTVKIDLATRRFSASANASLSPVVHEALRAQSRPLIYKCAQTRRIWR
jgi:hypothetical protein